MRHQRGRISLKVIRVGRRGGFVARWIDPETGRPREKSLGTHSRRTAYELARDMAAKIRQGVSLEDPTWMDFCTLYEDLHLSKRSAGHRENWRPVKWSVDGFFGPCRLSDLTAASLARWEKHLAEGGRAPNTVASYATRLRAALNWARKHDLLDRTPYLAVQFEESPRSRSITPEEFDRLLGAVPKVRPKDARHWEHFLWGLGWCNLRISELCRLSWDLDAPIHLDRAGKYPVIWMAPKGHKSHRHRLQPVLPQFWAVCCETPADRRLGLVFPIPNGRGGNMSVGRIIRTVAEIGRKAGIVTNPETRKTATSHDIGRRAFLAKIDRKLTVAEVHKAMGHASFQTTLDFYDTRDAEALSARLWDAEGGAFGWREGHDG